jgi:hypothetical protein
MNLTIVKIKCISACSASLLEKKSEFRTLVLTRMNFADRIQKFNF